MDVLLDSHILIWALSDDARLPDKAREILLDPENTVFYSAASIWELAIKHSLHPNEITLPPSEFIRLCQESGYEELPLRAAHANALLTLERSADAPRHKDPFDRMLIAQAKTERMTFLTHDALLPYYDEPCICFV